MCHLQISWKRSNLLRNIFKRTLAHNLQVDPSFQSRVCANFIKQNVKNDADPFSLNDRNLPRGARFTQFSLKHMCLAR